MKTLRTKLTALLLSLTVLITGLVSVGIAGGLQKETAKAETVNYDQSIYYFSDSKPVLSDDEITEEFGERKIYHDIHYLSSAQEFRYLLYTGYFWKFSGFDVAIVIQINSVTLDQKTWEDLYECLDKQQEEYERDENFMFITTDTQPCYHDYCKCDSDGFGEFLKKPFDKKVGCLIDTSTNSIKANSALLVEGNIVGINSKYGTYNLASLLYWSVPLRKLLNYMYYEFNNVDISDYEDRLYETLWNYYYENYLFNLGIGDSFLDMQNFNDVIKAWKSNEYEPVGEFWESHREEYLQYAYETFEQFYTEYGLFVGLASANIHLFAHAEDDTYFDLLDPDGSGNVTKYTFADYEALFNFLDPDITAHGESFDPNRTPITVCGMAAWEITDEFYDLLFTAQKAAENKPEGFIWNIDEVPVYLWEVGNVFWGTGGLQADFGENPELSEEERREILNKLAELLDRI